MTKITQKLRAFFHSKTGKIIPILLIALLIGTASSTVYQYYTAAATATVQTPDLVLRAGTDSTGTCTVYPCATVTVSSTNDFATIGLSFFPSVANTPQPASYYSNLTTIQNHRTGGATHTIKLIEAKVISGATNLGGINIYYCTTQTEFNPDGSVVTPANCITTPVSLTSSSSGWVSSGSLSLALANGIHSMGFIEVYAWAASAASGTVTFQLGIQWL